jgi:hypothetical protein
MNAKRRGQDHQVEVTTEGGVIFPNLHMDAKKSVVVQAVSASQKGEMICPALTDTQSMRSGNQTSRRKLPPQIGMILKLMI